MPHSFFLTQQGQDDERNSAVTNETRLRIGELLWRRLLSVHVLQPSMVSTRGAVVDARRAQPLMKPQLKRQT